MKNRDEDWQTIVKAVNLYKQEKVDIETRTAPKNLSARSLARDIFIYNKFGNNSEVASGMFIILYCKHKQAEWDGNIRIVTQSSSFIEPELSSDPLLLDMSMNYFNDYFEHLNPVAIKGTTTVLNTLKFSSKKVTHNLCTRISWTLKSPHDVAAHLKAYINYLEQLGSEH